MTVHRAVILHYDERTRQGLVTYAKDEYGVDAIDAISVALLVNERKTARIIKHEAQPLLREHAFSDRSAAGSLPVRMRFAGQIVQVITDHKERVVYVRPEPKDEP